MKDDMGVPGMEHVERLVAYLLSVLDRCDEDPALTLYEEEARRLAQLTSALSLYDKKRTTYEPRYAADRRGKYHRVKAIDPLPGVESCAK